MIICPCHRFTLHTEMAKEINRHSDNTKILANFSNMPPKILLLNGVLGVSRFGDVVQICPSITSIATLTKFGF